MELLQYKSKEMFSTSQLIDESQIVFDKIKNDEIEKAIILQDGKPKYLVIDFNKYEAIMSEYEELKSFVSIEKPKNKKLKKKKKNKLQKKEPLFKKAKEKRDVVLKSEDSAMLLAPTFPLPIDNPKPKKDVIVISKEDVEEELIETEELEEVELTQEEEINAALKSLDSINLDDNMKKIAQEKVKERILKARKEREQAKEEELQRQKEEEEEEKEITAKKEEEKKQKQEALSDFWS